MIDLKKFASCSNSTKNATISICRQIVETRDFSTFLNSSIEQIKQDLKNTEIKSPKSP
jgi:hypothetical protein